MKAHVEVRTVIVHELEGHESTLIRKALTTYARESNLEYESPAEYSAIGDIVDLMADIEFKAADVRKELPTEYRV